MNDTTRLPPEGFGQPADEWHASQGPYLDDLTAAERRAAPVTVRCEVCRAVIAVLTADDFLVTRSERRARPKRRAQSTYDKLIMADCGCPGTEPRRDAEGYLIPRHPKISENAFWHLANTPSEVPAAGITRSLLAP